MFEKMSTKRKTENIVAFVHAVSPSKRNFNVRLQTGDHQSMAKAICFDKTKRDILQDASVSGDPIKIKDIVRQEKSTPNCYADFIINQKTSVEKMDPVTVPFSREEILVRYLKVPDVYDCEVGSLISLKAKIDLNHAIEKTVTLAKRKAKVMNQVYLYTEDGSIQLSLWDDWITVITEEMKSHSYLQFRNLLLREFENEKFLSTCSDTQIAPITDEETPVVEFQSAAETPIHLTEIDIIHSINFGYKCHVCCKLIKVASTDTLLVKCQDCAAVQRTVRLEKSIEMVFEAAALGTKLYTIDLKQMQHLIGDISFDSDTAIITNKVMAIKDLFVNVDERENKVVLVT